MAWDLRDDDPQPRSNFGEVLESQRLDQERDARYQAIPRVKPPKPPRQAPVLKQLEPREVQPMLTTVDFLQLVQRVAAGQPYVRVDKVIEALNRE